MIWTVAIVIIATQPTTNKDQIFPHFDKVLHFGAFALLAILAIVATGGRFVFLSSVVFPSIIGVAVEIIQSKLPYRKASWGDFAADIAGGVVIFAIFMINKSIYARREPRHRD